MLKKIIALILAAACAAGVFALPASADTDRDLRDLMALGVFQGDGSGDMRLEDLVTRAQFAKLLAASSVYRDSVGAGGAGYSLYSDVKSGHWASTYIRLAAEQGWMNGYTDGSFHPEGVITLEEACASVLRLLGYADSELSGVFPFAQLQKAEALKLLDGLPRSQGEQMSRRDCVTLFHNLLLAEDKDGKLYAETLNLTVTNGEVDYNALLRRDLKGPYVAAADGAFVFPADYQTVYRNDHASTDRALLAGNVYYYNDTAKTGWIYTTRVSGKLERLNPSSSAPTSVTLSGTEYKIGGTDAAYRLSSLGGGSTGGRLVTLLLGMDSAVAGVETGVGPFVAAAGTRLDFTPATIYRDGLEAATAALKPGEVYYTDALAGVLWIYTGRASGRVTEVDYAEGRPSAVTVAGKRYTLVSDEAKDKIAALGDRAKDSYVTLLLGVDGAAAEVSVCSGPYVYGGAGALPFVPGTIYRDGIPDNSAALNYNDVYYYDRALDAAWIYTERVSGKIEAVSPENNDPESVTVGGKYYTLASPAAKNRVKSLGATAKDSYVTLLLGMNGEAAALLAGDEVAAMYYGVVTQFEKSAMNDKAELRTTLTILCMDGASRSFTVPENSGYSINNVVVVTVRQDNLTVVPAPYIRLSGKINGSVTRIDDEPLAENLRILDVGGGSAVPVDPKRLANTVLGNDDVKFFTRNAAGEIDNLVLNNATGDAWTYGFLTDTFPLFERDYEETVSLSTIPDGKAVSESLKRTYAWYTDGKQHTLSSESRFSISSYQPVLTGGMGISVEYAPDGSVRDLRSLKKIYLDDLAGGTARSENRFFHIAGTVQVYLKQDREYYLTELEGLNPNNFRMVGWYDDFTGGACGAIRLIIAEAISS